MTNEEGKVVVFPALCNYKSSTGDQNYLIWARSLNYRLIPVQILNHQFKNKDSGGFESGFHYIGCVLIHFVEKRAEVEKL